MEEKKKTVVTRLDNKYIENKTLESIREYKRKKFVRRRTIALVIGGLLLVALVTAPLTQSMQRADELEEERVLAMEELESLELYQDDLEYYIDLLEDEEYVAKLARSEYYVTQEDEIVFSIPEDDNPDHQEAIEEEEIGGENEY